MDPWRAFGRQQRSSVNLEFLSERTTKKKKKVLETQVRLSHERSNIMPNVSLQTQGFELV